MTATCTAVWLCDASEVSEAKLVALSTALGDSERDRMKRFVRAERLRQFVVGRILLREMLGGLLNAAPISIDLIERPGLAPLLISKDVAHFSISHSGHWVGCTASSSTALGLDIERIDQRRDILALAEQAFGLHEVALLRAAAPSVRHQLFYRLWCAHEAGIKLGQTSAVDYPLDLPGLTGVVACAAPLDAAPALELVRLQDL